MGELVKGQGHEQRQHLQPYQTDIHDLPSPPMAL
jgi:hypothetical protein